MADACSVMHAPPSQARINVASATSWTSLYLRNAAARWVLRGILRSAWPARGQALGFFRADFMEALHPGTITALAADCLIPKTVRTHRAPGGRRGGAAPMARAAPHPASITSTDGMARTGLPLDTCTATSSTASRARARAGVTSKPFPSGSFPVADVCGLLRVSRRARSHLIARSANLRLAALVGNGRACAMASAGASSQGGGRRMLTGRVSRGAGVRVSLPMSLLPSRLGERETEDEATQDAREAQETPFVLRTAKGYAGDGNVGVPDRVLVAGCAVTPTLPANDTRRRGTTEGVGVADFLLPSTLVATSTPTAGFPLVKRPMRCSGVVVPDVLLSSCFARTPTPPPTLASSTRVGSRRVDAADFFSRPGFVQAPTLKPKWSCVGEVRSSGEGETWMRRGWMWTCTASSGSQQGRPVMCTVEKKSKALVQTSRTFAVGALI